MNQIEIKQDPSGTYFIYVDGKVKMARWTAWGARFAVWRLALRLKRGLLREVYTVKEP